MHFHGKFKANFVGVSHLWCDMTTHLCVPLVRSTNIDFEANTTKDHHQIIETILILWSTHGRQREYYQWGFQETVSSLNKVNVIIVGKVGECFVIQKSQKSKPVVNTAEAYNFHLEHVLSCMYS